MCVILRQTDRNKGFKEKNMSALEIVLVAVASFLLFVILLYVIVTLYIKKFAAVKAEDFRIMDEFRKNREILFLGDSLTDFYPIEEFTDEKVVNRGIAGDTTDDVMRRIDEATGLKPKRLFLQIGINDMIRKGKRRLSADRLVDKIFGIADNFGEETEERNIISLYPVNRRKTIVSAIIIGKAKNKRIKEVNKLLRARCEKEGVNFIDVYDDLTDEKGNLKKEYTIEGLHLSVKGYAALSRKIAPLISENK